MSVPKDSGETEIIFLGDVMLGRLVDECIRNNLPEFVWGNTIDMLRNADAVIANLEAVIATGGKPWQPTKTFYFKAEPKAIDVLKTANISYVSNANNHAMDYDIEALLEMLEFFEKAKMPHAGAGRTLAEAMKPAVIQVGPLKIGIISWTDNMPEWAAEENKPGVFYLPVSDASAEILNSEIKKLKPSANLVVVSAHWGPNMVDVPSEAFQKFARSVIDGGADIFHGHSSHVFQGVEIYKGKIILYDTGEFVDDYAVDPYLRNDYSFLFRIFTKGKTMTRINLIPVVLNKKELCQVNIAHGSEAEKIMKMMEERSAPFKTPLVKTEDSLSINL